VLSKRFPSSPFFCFLENLEASSEVESEEERRREEKKRDDKRREEIAESERDVREGKRLKVKVRER
jgi:hypothetical protein